MPSEQALQQTNSDVDNAVDAHVRSTPHRWPLKSTSGSGSFKIFVLPNLSLLLLLCATVRWQHLFHRQQKVCCNFPPYKLQANKLARWQVFLLCILVQVYREQEFIVWKCISKFCVGLSACPYSKWTISGSTLWSMVPFGKVVVIHFMNKHHAFHETWQFITKVTNICNRILSWARWIQSSSQCIPWRSVLILSAH
jgi:hypothetical protein